MVLDIDVLLLLRDSGLLLLHTQTPDYYFMHKPQTSWKICKSAKLNWFHGIFPIGQCLLFPHCVVLVCVIRCFCKRRPLIATTTGCAVRYSSRRPTTAFLQKWHFYEGHGSRFLATKSVSLFSLKVRGKGHYHDAILVSKVCLCKDCSDYISELRTKIGWIFPEWLLTFCKKVFLAVLVKNGNFCIFTDVRDQTCSTHVQTLRQVSVKYFYLGIVRQGHSARKFCRTFTLQIFPSNIFLTKWKRKSTLNIVLKIFLN